MGKNKHDRVRRLAGGTQHADLALSAAVGRAMRAQRHDCRHNAALAVLLGYADVYVEGVLHNPEMPEGLAPDWMRNGSMHAWCMTKERRLIDPTLNAYTVPEDAFVLHEYTYQPLAVMTRGELRRDIDPEVGDLIPLLDRLAAGYTVPDGVAGWVRDDEDVEARSAAAVAEAEERARAKGLL